MTFTKMHGLGNDYVVVECFTQRVEPSAEMVRALEDRHTGIGSDGLILIRPSESADVRMEMYNADGSRGRMCGNGIRCVGKFAYERGLAKVNPMRVETDAGVRELRLVVEDGWVSRVRVDMGVPSLRPGDLPCRLEGDRIVEHPMTIAGQPFAVTCVSMGNPHAVIFVDDLEAVDLCRAGPAGERSPEYPERVNVQFVQVVSRTHLRVRTWERGSGPTQACGTGACAVCVAGAVTGRSEREVTVTVPGGDLAVRWADDDHVYMIGPAGEVFSGEWAFLP
ncbi:MAG: diaminopimelate epimerase [Phycisphaerae bacterium]